MAEEERAKMSNEEFERLSQEYAMDKGDENDIWELKPSRFMQGNYFAIRRVTRFTLYQAFKYSPTLFYDKVFTKAYLPFTVRHNYLTAGIIAFGYISYLGIYKTKHKYFT